MHDHEHNEASVIPSPASSGLTGIFSGASPKLTFVMGLLVGGAGESLIGFVLAASFSFSCNGKKLKIT